MEYGNYEVKVTSPNAFSHKGKQVSLSRGKNFIPLV